MCHDLSKPIFTKHKGSSQLNGAGQQARPCIYLLHVPVRGLPANPFPASTNDIIQHHHSVACRATIEQALSLMLGQQLVRVGAFLGGREGRWGRVFWWVGWPTQPQFRSLQEAWNFALWDCMQLTMGQGIILLLHAKLPPSPNWGDAVQASRPACTHLS